MTPRDEVGVVISVLGGRGQRSRSSRPSSVISKFHASLDYIVLYFYLLDVLFESFHLPRWIAHYPQGCLLLRK